MGKRSKEKGHKGPKPLSFLRKATKGEGVLKPSAPTPMRTTQERERGAMRWREGEAAPAGAGAGAAVRSRPWPWAGKERERGIK